MVSPPPILFSLQWLYTLKTKNVYFVRLFVKKALSLIQFCVFSFLPCLPSSSRFAVNFQVRQKSFF